MSDDLVDLKELIKLSYDALPGPYFLAGHQLFAYDKFGIKVQVCDFSHKSMTGEQLKAIATMFMLCSPSAVRDMARAVQAVEVDAARYRYMRLHGLYELKNMTGDGLDKAVDVRREQNYDDD